jgi:hypothetical protein
MVNLGKTVRSILYFQLSQLHATRPNQPVYATVNSAKLAAELILPPETEGGRLSCQKSIFYHFLVFLNKKEDNFFPTSVSQNHTA